MPESRNGFTLIELQIGLAIGVIGILIFSSGFISISRSTSLIQGNLTRNELSIRLRNAITNRTALKKTILQNPELHAVVHNDYSMIPGGRMISNQFYDVSIFDVFGEQVSGPATNPIYYTTDGFRCQIFGVSKCLITVKSSFLFQGIPQEHSQDRMIPTSQYPVAANINVDFIQINYSISFSGTDTEIGRKDINGAVFVSFDDIGL